MHRPEGRRSGGTMRRCGCLGEPSSRSSRYRGSSRSRPSSITTIIITMLLLLAALAGARVASAGAAVRRRAAFLSLPPPSAPLRSSSRAVAARAASTTSSSSTAAAPPSGKSEGKAPKEVFDIPHFDATPATPADLRCIEERQLLHQVTCAGGPRKRCQHGFPQAFVFHPSKTAFNSGLFRLTCPLLVKAVDEYEAQGGLAEFNHLMSQDPAMQREFRRVNARHSVIRRQLAEPEQLEPYIAKLGPQVVEQILASGIAGVSPEKTEDLKCLHAHLADWLCTRDNGVGQRVYETLRDKKGVEVDGCATCWQQCDVAHERTEESWWYTPVKNKQKLRSRYERRHKRKAEIRQQGLSSNPYQRGRLLEDDEEGEGPAREGEGQRPVGGGGVN